MERNNDDCNGGSSASSSRTAVDSLPVPSQPGTAVAPSSSNNGTGLPRFPSPQNSPVTSAAPQYPMAQPQQNLTNGVHTNHSNSREAFAANLGAQLAPLAPRMRNPAPPHIFTRGRSARRSSGPYQLRPKTFWTFCDRCRVHHEYRWIYLNQTLLCPICRVPFMAVETPAPNVNRHT